jgi:hypothetical protein
LHYMDTQRHTSYSFKLHIFFFYSVHTPNICLTVLSLFNCRRIYTVPESAMRILALVAPEALPSFSISVTT